MTPHTPPPSGIMQTNDDTFRERFEASVATAPVGPTDARPRSYDKVVVLAARYREGLPLFDDGDEKCDPEEFTRSYRLLLPKPVCRGGGW